MLYHLYDMQHAGLAPFRVAAEVLQYAFQSPLAPISYTGVGRTMAAAAELFERTTRRFGQPEWGLDETYIDGDAVPVAPRAVLEKPWCTLTRFERGVERDDPKVLVVAPLSGHWATLLRGTVAALLPEHDVYITEWQDARQVPLSRGAFGLDDYIAYVEAFLHHLGPNTHVMAVCQPAVPVLAAVTHMAMVDDPCQPTTMTLMGGPVDTRRAATAPTKLAERHSIKWFERTVISTVPPYYPGAFRQVYPGFVQLTGFMSMNLDRHVISHLRLFNHLVQGDGESAETTRKFYDEYMAVMDLSAEFYLETVERVFQKQLLARGQYRYKGRTLKPEAIRKTALLTVEGELDDISAPGQTIAAHDLCAGLPAHMHKNHLQPAVGHYGIFNGRKWREQIMPVVRGWMRRFDEGRAPICATTGPEDRMPQLYLPGAPARLAAE